MLNPQEIQTLKASMGGTSASGTSSTPNKQVLDDASFAQWAQPSKATLNSNAPISFNHSNQDISQPIKQPFSVNTDTFGGKDIPAGIVATLGNAVMAPVVAGAQAVRLPFQVKNIFTENGGKGVLGKYTEGVDSIMQGINDTLISPLANTVGGVLSEVGNVGGGIVNKITGINDTTDLGRKGNEALRNAPENVSNLIKGVTKFGIEQPTTAALTLQQGYQKLSGNPEADLIHDVGGKVIDTAKNIPLPDMPHPLTALKKYLAEKNVNPQVETAASRLDDPLDQYNKYAQQAQANKFDASEDKPLEQVGQDAGNAFKKVVKMRQQVGKMMADELKRSEVGDAETDTTVATNNLNEELKANNLRYNGRTGTIQDVGQSKMTSVDRDLLQDYKTQLKELGPNPSVKDLDSFMSRVSQEMDIYKDKNSIVGTTNGERIIKNNLDTLRNQFDATKMNNPALEDYSDFRKAYADLSGTIDEAKQYFGKVNPDGSFARDASLVKSSITSLLGGNKRAVLSSLQELTGDPILDKAVMAAQAMQDAGDASGTSLLQELYNNPPTSASGLTAKILNWGIGKAKNAFVGDPSEQTRTFLQSLQGNTDISTNSITNIPSAVTASGGESASSMKNNNSSINNSIPPSKNMSSEGGYIKNPFADTKNVTADLQKYVDGTVKTMKDYMNDPEVKAAASAKGIQPDQTPNMIATVQRNIVDGLSKTNPSEMPIIQAIGKLDPASFFSLDGFNHTVNSIIESMKLPSLQGSVNNILDGVDLKDMGANVSDAFKKKMNNLALRTSRPATNPEYTEPSSMTGGRSMSDSYLPRYYPGLGWNSADTTVPSNVDTIDFGVKNSTGGDLPTNIPQDYIIEKTKDASAYPGYNDLINNSNKMTLRDMVFDRKPKDYYNEKITPFQVTPEDRKIIDEYLKSKGKVGPLKKISHSKGADDIFYGDKYARDDIEHNTLLSQLSVGFKDMLSRKEEQISGTSEYIQDPITPEQKKLVPALNYTMVTYNMNNPKGLEETQKFNKAWNAVLDKSPGLKRIDTTVFDSLENKDPRGEYKTAARRFMLLAKNGNIPKQLQPFYDKIKDFVAPELIQYEE